jgi:peptidylprolyl isomerase
MSEAKSGDTVKVRFTGRLENGEVFTRSEDENPLELTLGTGQLIEGFENGVMGMKVGEKKTITVPPEQGYGSRQDELVVEVDRRDLPDHITPAVGKALKVRRHDGEDIHLIIMDMNEDTVTLDANHPLAGITLFFDLELVAIA